MTTILGAVITAATWIGPQAIEVAFASAQAGMLHQLYAGRTLIGVTAGTSDRIITGGLKPELCPCPLQLITVPVADRYTDYGSRLPKRRPYNRFRLNWSAASFAADADRFIIEGANAPDTAPAVFLGAVEFQANGDYSFDPPGVTQSGEWQYRVTPKDDAAGPDQQTEGNSGTAATVTVAARVYPPDPRYVSQRRFTIAISNSQATVSVNYNW